MLREMLSDDHKELGLHKSPLPFEERVNVVFCHISVLQVLVAGENVAQKCQRGEIHEGSVAEGGK